MKWTIAPHRDKNKPHKHLCERRQTQEGHTVWFCLQAELEDAASSVPDHLNKANITIKQVTWTFWFPSVYKGYVYTMLSSIKCATALCRMSNYVNIRTLIKNTWLLKNVNHPLSLQRVIVATTKPLITDHHNKYCNEKALNIARITKMCHRDTKWANAVRKMAPIDLLDTDLP